MGSFIDLFETYKGYGIYHNITNDGNRLHDSSLGYFIRDADGNPIGNSVATVEMARQVIDAFRA